jgi:RNA 3'-terminal phosphate cyclase (ATP)
VITIDGAQMSGSGTIARYAVALAALLGKLIRIINARDRRREPLRPQHVTGVRGCGQLCDATVEGVEVGSRTFEFVPESHIRGGHFEWDIGTAVSATRPVEPD